MTSLKIDPEGPNAGRLILTKGGKAFICDGCPCDTDEPIVVPGLCSPNPCSSGTTECWEITIAGVVDDSCSDCSVFNGTHILRKSSSGNINCVFSKEVGDICGFLSRDIDMRITGTTIGCVGTNTEKIIFTGGAGSGGIATYVHSTGTFDCNGPNVFNFSCVGLGTECQNWPATITAIPAVCP